MWRHRSPCWDTAQGDATWCSHPEAIRQLLKDRTVELPQAAAISLRNTDPKDFKSGAHTDTCTPFIELFTAAKAETDPSVHPQVTR